MPDSPHQFFVAGRRVDADANSIELPDGWRHVKPRSMAVLEYLARHPGTVCTREKIMDAVWGDVIVSDEVLSQAIRELRTAFGDDARDPGVIETIPRGGYRLIAEVSAAEPAPRRGRSKWLISAGAGLLAALAIVLWLVFGPNRTESDQYRLAVMPFEYMGESARHDYFSDGLTEELIAELSRVDPTRLAVIARTSVMHFKDQRPDLADIVKRLEVDYVIEGSVRLVQDRVRITAQLIDAENETHLWADSYDGMLENILELQGKVSTDIAREIRVSLIPDRSASRDVIDPDAYHHFLLGKSYFYRFSSEGYARARDEFASAIELAPEFAQAHAWLGAAYSGLAFGERSPQSRARYAQDAQEAIKHALELSPELGMARWLLAWQAFAIEWDWERAERLYQEALEIDPNLWWTHWGYGELLSALGRHEEAIDRMQRARELDPVNPFVYLELAAVYNHADQFDQARSVLQEGLEVLPHHPGIYGRLIKTHEHMGRYEDAIETRRIYAGLIDREYDAEAHRAAYTRGGESAYWQWLLENPNWRQSGIARARALVRLGRHDEALDLLEEAVRRRVPPAIYIGVYPDLSPLRDRPRFRQLLQEMGLYGAERE